MHQSSHYNHGKSKKIAFVFSCPGQEEDKLGKPTAGQTGDNLDVFLKELFNKNSINRYDFRITNAFDKVFYESKDGRTEATTQEIISLENLERLYDEISDIENVIIAFGKKAKMALDEVSRKFNLKAKIVETKHLGLQSLNTMEISNPNNLSGRDLVNLKIQTLAKEISQNL